MNDQLLEYIKTYRRYLGKTPLPTMGESEGLMVSRKTRKPLKITQLYSLVKAIGEETAKGLGSPDKQKKLRALSPHWIRHLAASHQDRLGMPLSMIQENLRHQSSQTTQIYVHTEDDERFKQMQKMQMDLRPCQITKEKKVIGVEYQLSLEKGPVNKVLGLTRLILGIEQQLFKELDWRNVGESKDSLLERVKREGIVCSKIQITYQIQSEKIIEYAKVWAEALKRQCEIWLFTADIQMVEIEERHG